MFSPLSPSNDVLFSSASTMPINTDSHAKLSNCSTTLDSMSSPQQQWNNVVQTQPYEYVSYPAPTATNTPVTFMAPAPINY